MSKLPKAPLIEVVFEVKWPVTTKEELNKCQNLQGDYYQLVKKEFDFRETVMSAEVPMALYVNQVAQRYRVADGGYPLLQLGPGILTVNTIDSKYIWEEYEKLAIDAFDKLIGEYEFLKDTKLTLILQYFDFIPFDFNEGSVYDFYKDFLHLEIKQEFYKHQAKPADLRIELSNDSDLGMVTIKLGKGQKDKVDGVIINTIINHTGNEPEISVIKDWLNEAHEICSTTFKKMTEGPLYESFKVK